MGMSDLLGYIWRRIKNFSRDSMTKKVLSVLLFFVITIMILFSNFNPKQVALKPDEVATQDITSPINATIIDDKKTEELRQQAADRVQKLYKEDQYALPAAIDDIEQFYTDIEDVLATAVDEAAEEDLAAENDEAKRQELLEILENTNNLNIELQLKLDTLAEYLLYTKEEDRKQILQSTLDIVKELMAKPVTDETLPGLYTQADNEIYSLPYSAEAREIIKIISINSLRANLLFDKEGTEKAIQEARESVKPVQKNIKIGESIVREGDRITAEQISILEQLGIQRTGNYTYTLIGTVIITLLAFWLFLEYLRRYHKEVYKNDMHLLMIGLIFILVLGISRFITAIQIGSQPEINMLMGYLAPVAAGSMLIAILLDDQLAYFLTMIMAIFVGFLMDGNQLSFAITAFVGGSVGVFHVHRLSQTTDLTKAGVFVAIANILTIVTLLFIGGELSLNTVLIGIIIGAVNGLLSAVLMIGVLPYLEAGFSITSMAKLLELANPNTTLLRRLLMEAPGTYHHSLMVGNLAEASAEAIGANPLLVRVGALYHDIGKIKRPEYFVENQRFDNPHEKIAPALSSLIITSHVKEGVELAREARIPDVIIDFIEQHHGTSLAKYFYSRALEEDPDGKVSEDNYRYEGPRPQSKEVALVMLADGVEAAVRSLPNPSPEKINNMIKAIIKDKLNDAQLELCDLTFKDLDTIANSFCNVLEGIYHKRIEYPEVIKKEFEQRSDKLGNNDSQPAE